MTRFEEFKQEVANCKSPLELSAILATTNSSICPINSYEGRCDMKICRQYSQDCCLMGMREYFESESSHATPSLDIHNKKKQFSWAFLKKEIKAGNARKYLAVEDEIEIKLKDGRLMPVVVAGIDTYNKNEVLFTIKDCWFEEAAMNKESTNKGGYLKSKMHIETLPGILKLLPDELVEAITPRKITQVLDGKEYFEEAKLWLWSYTEMFGDADLDDKEKARDKGDKWVELFKYRRNRIKEFNGQAYWYWLRSPHINWTTYFWYVSSDGGVYIHNAGYSSGVCFGFCI